MRYKEANYGWETMQLCREKNDACRVVGLLVNKEIKSFISLIGKLMTTILIMKTFSNHDVNTLQVSLVVSVDSSI